MNAATRAADDVYNALTLELERAEILTEHLAERLVDLMRGEDHEDEHEIYALNLIAEHIQQKHARIREQAHALRVHGRLPVTSTGSVQ